MRTRQDANCVLNPASLCKDFLERHNYYGKWTELLLLCFSVLVLNFSLSLIYFGIVFLEFFFSVFPCFLLHLKEGLVTKDRKGQNPGVDPRLKLGMLFITQHLFLVEK